jgi:two-component system, NtrC family, sensor histidine kinase HydH
MGDAFAMLRRMNAWALRRWVNGTALLQSFGIVSFVVISLITLAFSLVVFHSMKADLLDREWTGTADFIRTEAHQVLTPQDFADPDSASARARFRYFYQQTAMMPEIVRVKIYDTTMRVIWSDEPRLIGERFSDNPELTTALGGRTTVNLESADKPERVYEGDRRYLAEVYVPIVFPGSPAVVGAVETYKEPLRVFASIRAAQVRVVTTALLSGALLYLSLFWVVRQAARRIEAQHKSLEQRTGELATANRELQTVQAQLLRTERMAAIGEVVTAVAHGIRNPLANIRASAQVALLDCGGCPKSTLPSKGMANIITEVDRLERRVKDLLGFVRPAQRRNRPVELNDAVDEALRLLDGRLTEAGVTIDKKCAPTLPLITADPMLVEQILVNIIGNAIEASPAGGAVGVTTGVASDGDDPPSIFVEVQDSGPGIATEDVSKIFELFYTTKAQGTGVGLALAKKFTEAHSGTLTVASRPGGGARFRVTLPVKVS